MIYRTLDEYQNDLVSWDPELFLPELPVWLWVYDLLCVSELQLITIKCVARLEQLFPVGFPWNINRYKMKKWSHFKNRW